MTGYDILGYIWFDPRPSERDKSGKIIELTKHVDTTKDVLGSKCKFVVKHGIDGSASEHYKIIPKPTKKGSSDKELIGGAIYIDWVREDGAQCECCTKMRFIQKRKSSDWGTIPRPDGDEPEQFGDFYDAPSVHVDYFYNDAKRRPTFEGSIRFHCLSKADKKWVYVTTYKWSVKIEPNRKGGWDVSLGK